jgi:hypothetical protein
MKDLDVATGRWWRWTRYEIRDSFIRPARGAQLQIYDPWQVWLKTRPLARSSSEQKLGETPYQSLLALLAELEYRQPGEMPLDLKPGEVDLVTASLTAESEAKLLGWCADYGLLGVLPHRALQVTLAEQTGIQLQYTKFGAGWIVTERKPPVTTGALIQPLRGISLVAEPLSATWSCFFPDVPPHQRDIFGYPEPLSEEFWKLYAEPVAHFLSGMHALQELHQAIRLFQARSPAQRELANLQAVLAGGSQLLAQGLVGGVGMALQWNPSSRSVHQKFVGSSLLASLAMMMVNDLSYGRALRCPRCGRAFVSGAYQARYCSVGCRWVVQKREVRRSRARLSK